MAYPLPKSSASQSAAEDTRTSLLNAATEVFAEVGYRAATIRQISARAGTNVALVNYHFGDKLTLYTEVLRRTARSGQFDSIRAALAQDAPPEEILRRVIRARLQGACEGERPDLVFRIMAHEHAQPTAALSRVINEAIRPVYDGLRQVIGKIIGLQADDQRTRLCTHSVIGQIIFYVVARPGLARLWPDLKMTPRQMDQIADHIADFSLAYLHQVALNPMLSTAKTKKKKR
jgi:TetR/AcrR family transcriptional regulator, regulator of cefoperazone and chloramphenicol sensitivity